ncbi:universal stress protein [Mycobacterium branderi]|nr:universal stress protein [Mycobacterium branderi]MCV7231316.1 universal stress protein [Mycobacterium branderi]ORA31702.1 universal stress protein UspA [Mycobacterium branderi]
MPASIKHPGIVVGVDGSVASQAAVRWAVHEAAMRDVPLTLVHAVDAALSTWPHAPVPNFEEWLAKRGRAFLDDAVDIARENAAAAGRPEVHSYMLFAAAVLTLVDFSKEAEMIVVGCRRGGGPTSFLLGSVSSGLVYHAHCPVAVVHDENPPLSDAPVLVGIDGSPASELATAIAFDEASRRRVELLALHAWSDREIFELPGLDWEIVKQQEELSLAERLAGWQERYPDVKVGRMVVCDRPARQLIEQSAIAQLVVVGSHGRGGFAGMLLGSVSAAVVHSARIPVIVARQS